MKDYRLSENRWEGCKQYFKEYVESNDINVEEIAIKNLVGLIGLSREQMLWYSFLYSMTHNVFSAWSILYEFPEWNNINMTKFERYWKQEKKPKKAQT